MNETYYEVWIQEDHVEDRETIKACMHKFKTISEVTEVIKELNSMRGVKVVEKKVPLTLADYDGDGNNRYNSNKV